VAIYAGGLIPWIELRFLKLDATTGELVPNASGTIETYVAGTSTPLATYADANLITANPTTITIDASGFPSNSGNRIAMFLQPTGYKFIVKNSAGTTLYTIDLVEDVGQVFAATFGHLASAGGKNVTSGYTVLSTDRLVTVASSGGPNPCVINLPVAANYKGMLAIKNLGTVPLAITPSGTQTIDTLNAVFTVSAAASPAFPSKMLINDGVSAWWVLNVS
jgi:hypothetical protein